MREYKPEPISVMKGNLAIIVKIGDQKPVAGFSLDSAVSQATNQFLRNLYAELAQERKQNETVSKNPSKT